MKETIKFIPTDELQVLAATTYLYEFGNGEIRYYVGTVSPSGSACRLSKWYRYEQQAQEALENEDYDNRVTIKTFPNGLTLYFPYKKGD